MSHIITMHLSESPNIFALMSRAVLPKKKPDTIDIPKLSVDLKGVKANSTHLRKYSKVIGFQLKSYLPSTLPHIMAFPLHMKLLTDNNFPLPLLGLVHYQNSITQHRPLKINEVFDIDCLLTNHHKTSMGVTFDIVTTVTVGGKVVWEETSTFLHRSKQKNKNRTKNRKPLPSYSHDDSWSLPSSLGRQYAKVSNDFNLIHLFSWSAKAFGFNQAIIHGMWVKARCIAALTESIGEQAFKADVTFKLPVFLPGTVSFNWQRTNELINFQLLDKNLTKPHLSGKITLL